MAYDARLLRDAVTATVQARPCTTLKSVATSLGVGEHTVGRALGEVGLGFRELRQRIIVELAEEMRRTELLSVKEIAYRLGYSQPGSLARLVRRSRKTRLTPPGTATARDRRGAAVYS